MRWILPWYPSLSQRLASHLVPNGLSILFVPDKASATFVLAWARIPFTAKRVVVPFRALVGLGSYSLPNVSWFIFAPEWALAPFALEWTHSPFVAERVFVPFWANVGLGFHSLPNWF